MSEDMLADSGLHDWKLGRIIVNYGDAEIRIRMYSPAGKAETLCSRPPRKLPHTACRYLSALCVVFLLTVRQHAFVGILAQH